LGEFRYEVYQLRLPRDTATLATHPKQGPEKDNQAEEDQQRWPVVSHEAQGAKQRSKQGEENQAHEDQCSPDAGRDAAVTTHQGQQEYAHA